ncbi:MAG: hypothetical protein A3F72_19110 [Bacteroidetes bacterium RIFCSPLOWO2_12_FULL_35_15]|nr:MAG: hypothetical protein A3F72_19110 [Bacteroidetes bacterium RIFCSPLOWO2_12_FULL_35_15]
MKNIKKIIRISLVTGIQTITKTTYMKKTKKMFQTIFLSLSLLFAAKGASAQAISSHFFGENAWMPYAIGNTILGGKLDQHWGDIKNSNASMIRYGGIAVDENMPTNAQYIAIIDSIRANGMEPIMQVPFNNYTFTAQQAANIVTYINVTMGRNIKYWIIGNEPELGYSFTTSSQVAGYIKPFASAMKNVDPSIKIIGPESAWLAQNVINGLTTANGPDDITGKDAAGRYYLDVISFHTYPFNGTQTRAQVLTKLTSPGSLQDNLTYLNGRVSACNTAHNRTGAAALKIAITEMNICYKNASTDNLQGVGANSFIGGQFVAEMMGISMKNGVDFINLWSVIEGNSTELNIGYLDRTTGNKKPLYYHFKMMAENFKGNSVNATTNQSTVKSFGSKDAQQISVLILNEDLTNNYNFTVSLNTTAIAGSAALKININAGLQGEYNGVISNQSSTLLKFDVNGNILEKTEYKLNGNADANLPPTVTVLATTTGIASNTIPERGLFEITNLFPNPSPGKFTVQLNKENTGIKDFEITIYNLIGQEVYNKKAVFLNGKEEIELDPSMANGEYIVRIKESEKDNYLVKKIILQK